MLCLPTEVWRESNEIMDVKVSWKYKLFYNYKVLIISTNVQVCKTKRGKKLWGAGWDILIPRAKVEK